MSLAGCGGNQGGETTEETTETTTEATEATTQEPDTVEEKEEVPTGGTLTYGMSAKPDTANILTSGSVYSAVALNLVVCYGVRTDPVTYEPKPWVFTDWKVENYEGEDAKPDVYFNVREGLTWTDGEDFTKEDVQFTYDYLIENEPGEYAGSIRPIETVEQSNTTDSEGTEWDFHMKLTQKVGTWETGPLGGLPMLAKHQYEGIDYKNFKPMESDAGTLLGLGPGKLTKFEPDTSMRVEFTNKESFKKLSNLQWRKDHEQIIAGGPFIDAVNFKIFGSESAMTQAYMQGEIDTHYGTLQTAKIPEAQDAEGLDLINGFDSGFSYFGWNLRRKPIDDATLRQAMAFVWDEYYWVETLNRGYVIKGDYPHSPGYRAARPETKFGDEVDRDVKLLTDPATNAFDFRQTQPGIPDVEGVRKFLTDGKVVTGEAETVIGKEFPGTLSGVRASQSESKYEYTFGEVKSQVLKEHDGTDQEIRVDGKTIPEMMDGDAITFFIDPPQKQPREAKAIQNWVDNIKSLGIPVKTQVLSFNTMVSKAYYEEDFDMYPMGWGGTGPFGDSLYFFFHTDNADVEGNMDSFVYNSTGYGLGENGYEEAIGEAYSTMDREEMTKAFARANERIYLDMPYYLMDYADMRWPVNSADWTGFVGGVVDPAYANWTFEAYNVHKSE